MDSVLHGSGPNCYLEKTLNPHLCGALDQPLLPGLKTFDASNGRFLTGLLPVLKSRLKEHGVRYRVVDARPPDRRTERWTLDPSIVLRDYQQRLVDQAAAKVMGLIEAGTGAGKTVVGAALIARLGVRTIWLTTTRVLLDQARDDLRRLLGAEPGVIGGGVHDPGPLTVALVQAVSRRPDLVRGRGFGLMIFDEGHHGAAPTFARAVRAIDARRNYYLSAVPERGGDDQVVLASMTGGVVASAPARTLVRESWLAPVEARWVEMPIVGKMTELGFSTIYRRFLCGYAPRNDRIAAEARALAEQGETVLILVERVSHGEELRSRLGDEARFLHGRRPRREGLEVVEMFGNGRLGILIATSSLFAEGVNIVNISAVIWAGGMKSRTKVLQAVGRGMRPSPGKRRCLYVDFMDRDILGLLIGHSRERRRALVEAGLIEDDQSEETT